MLYIYTQDRQALIPINAELRVSQYYGNTTECGIFCNGVVIGKYNNKERAEEVLRNIVISMFNKEKIFRMPEK